MSTKGASQPHNSLKRKRSNKNSNESNNGSIGSNERPAQACPHSTSSSGSFGSDQSTINPAPNKLRLVLLGETGAGKSATGNTILGNRRFDDGLSMSSVTKECKRECATMEERELVLVDTPGFFDTTLTKVEVQQEVIRCLDLSSPGPHAFLLVVPIERFTEEQQRTVDMILEMFHEDVTHHTILIFSHVDKLGGGSIEEFISNQNQKVQELVERFGRRFVAFDNTNPTNRDQVSRLLQRVDKLLAENENRYYTSEITEIMQKGNTGMEKKLAERIIQIKTEVNKLADQRWRKFTAHMNEVSEETDRNRKRIQRRIDGIEKDIEKEKKNVRPIPARLTRFRASLHTEKENLRRLLNREKKERTEKEEKEKKDLEIWKKEEEQRRLSEEGQNRIFLLDDQMEWLIKKIKPLLKFGAQFAYKLLIEYLFQKYLQVIYLEPESSLKSLSWSPSQV